jgi:hypothetical protein
MEVARIPASPVRTLLEKADGLDYDKANQPAPHGLVSFVFAITARKLVVEDDVQK